MKKPALVMSFVLTAGLALAGSRSARVVDQGDGNWTIIEKQEASPLFRKVSR